MIELVSLKEQEETGVIPLSLSDVKTQQEGSCTAVIYKKFIHLVIHMTKTCISYIGALHSWILTYSSPNPWNFPSVESDKSISCDVNEVTLPIGWG